MIRQPYVAGYFYPGTAEQINKAMESLVNTGADRGDAVGLLIPHAGYQYSGRVAGETLSRVQIKDTVIIIGPSHSGKGQPFSVMASGSWETPLGQVEIDAALAQACIESSGYLQADEEAHAREHAIEVQLPFLQHLNPDVRIVPLILADAPPAIYQEIGRDIARAIRQTGRDVLIIASGDMTHYEPDAEARTKDMKAIEAMIALDEEELAVRYKKHTISMCAFGPVTCLMSAAHQLGVSSAELISYATSGDTTGDRDAVVGYAGVVFWKNSPDPLVKLARETIETWVKEGKQIAPPSALTEDMQQSAGVFVSIHKKNGDLRGCIGTFEPQQASVAQEIITNAISSATRDPRFRAVSEHELPDLEYSVDVLTPPEPVDSTSDLDPKRYGVIVVSGWRRGLLLPDLEDVNTPEQQIDICRRKAGIKPDEPVELFRFEVKRHK